MYTESFIPSDLHNQFNKHFSENREWSGKITAKELFSVWKKMKLETVSSTMEASESVETSGIQEPLQKEYSGVQKMSERANEVRGKF